MNTNRNANWNANCESSKNSKSSSGSRRLLCLLLSAVLCAAVLFIPGCGPESSGTGSTAITASASEVDDSAAGSLPDTVTVSARGSSYAVPDRAELRFGVRTQAKTASEAQTANSKNVNAVISVLKKNNVKEEDIQTTWYDVSPQYDWNTGNGDTITGYSVSTSLCVKNIEIKDAGTLIAACTEAGANEFNGVSYSCTEYDKFYGEALKEAVTSSKEKAALLAEAAGRTLGEVTRISEGWQDTTYEANAKGVSSMEGAGALDEGAGASILPGQAEITATVTVTYILK